MQHRSMVYGEPLGNVELLRSASDLTVGHVSKSIALISSPCAGAHRASCLRAQDLEKAGILAMQLCEPRHASRMVAPAPQDKHSSGSESHLRCLDSSHDDHLASLVLTLVHRLMRHGCVRAHDVGTVQVGSASLADRSKSIKSELMSLVEPGCNDADGVDHCDAEESALRACISWAAGASWDGRWAIVTCSVNLTRTCSSMMRA